VSVTSGPSLLHPRAAGGAAVVGNEIVVVGGRVGNPEQVTQIEICDGTGWRDAADIPVPGDHLAVTADSSYLYAVGGRKFTAGSNTDVQRYDPKADRWDILSPTPASYAHVTSDDLHRRLPIRSAIPPRCRKRTLHPSAGGSLDYRA
jgi:hypothetical protein